MRVTKSQWVGILLAGATFAVSLTSARVREAIRMVIPKLWLVQLSGFRFGYAIDHDLRITMPDGVHLAASLYLPKAAGEKLATILVRQPYNRLSYGEGLRAATFFAKNGYAVVVQDIRGKFASEGEFVPYRSATSDGVATLDWIVAQPWSNGKVGTWGCSGLGELQLTMARANHAAHSAMVVSGAGGGVGSLAGGHSHFGVFEGGIFQLASGFGWFLENGSKNPSAPPAGKIDIASAIRGLPSGDLVQRFRPFPNGYDNFIRRPFSDPWWTTLDYVSDSDRIRVPTLAINTWGDQTVGETLLLAEKMRHTTASGPPEQHVVLAPGTHCHFEETGTTGEFGDLHVENAAQPYEEWYLRWFDQKLRGRGRGLSDMPAYLFYVIGENVWLRSKEWPPENTHVERWYLASGGNANGPNGDGVLAPSIPTGAEFDQFAYDPSNPVPSVGGPICCTGNLHDRAGPVDQREVENRADVLLFTSAPLQVPLRIAGPIHATLHISSSAKDTDFVAKLTHVWPDGKSTNIQEGALRARYRTGLHHPTQLTAGEPVEITIDMRSIAYLVPAGHRIRLQVTSSSFPRLERNLNTGGRNFDESVGIIAVNRIYHEPHKASFIEFYRMPAAL